MAQFDIAFFGRAIKDYLLFSAAAALPENTSPTVEPERGKTSCIERGVRQATRCQGAEFRTLVFLEQKMNLLVFCTSSVVALLKTISRGASFRKKI